MTEPQAMENTDRELWREDEGDYYSPSIHVTKKGGIGINVGGTVAVLTLREWHALVCSPKRKPALAAEGEGEQEATVEWAKTLPGAQAYGDKAIEVACFGIPILFMWVELNGDGDVAVKNSRFQNFHCVIAQSVTRRRFRALLEGLGITERVEEGGE